MKHTPELLVQRFLRTEGSLQELQEKYALLAKRHKQHNNLVLLKYNQTESDFSQGIVQECRGIILDEPDNWNVVSYAYNKFFNYGEPLAEYVDLHMFRAYEKLDGSLMCLYGYKGEWQVSTSGTPDAEAPVNENLTFKELFWRTFEKCHYKVPDVTKFGHFTFVFELMCPENRIVVQHKEPRLVLHGVRDLATLREHHPEMLAERLGFECAKYIEITSLESIVELSKTLKPLEQEGYVVVDKHFNRVKIKSPKYVLAHHLRDNMTTRKIIEMLQINETSEFLTYFPECREMIETVSNKVQLLATSIDQSYQEICNIPIQKDFALEALKAPFPSALFSIRKGTHTSGWDWVAKQSSHKIEDFIK